MTFPTVNGSNLQRAKLTLPQDFEGDYNLLFIAFQQWQQDEVNTWIALAENCEARFPGLVYYELPTIRVLSGISKFFINEGMRGLDFQSLWSIEETKSLKIYPIPRSRGIPSLRERFCS